MARGSGMAKDGLIEGGFTHAASGIRYQLFLRDGQAWMRYERTVPGTGPPLHGEQLLSYYVGSGRRGRTYLFERDGWWFEAPVNYYSKKQLWDMAPNYGSARSMPDTLPVDSNCLHCHAGQVQSALPEARNKYADMPFKAGGVTCTACHGDASQHLAQKGRGPIVNPAKLAPASRDSVCLQCHLEGDAAIYRAGESLAAYRPGEDLARFVVYFVNASRAEGGGRATSQYEALLRSACKRASGDKLTCTTCHDPHGTPTAAERVSFYRSKCLACHTGEKMATEHHTEQQDCAVCHMPTRETTDVSHEQLTDHDIERVPGKARVERISESTTLVPAGGVSAGDRELGLAYAQFGVRGDQQSGEKALALLKMAESEGANDAELHVRLGFLEQVSGHPDEAQREYQAALAENPYESAALANLAVLDASRGKTEAAIALLGRVVAADPSQTAAGLNLAFLQCKLGDKAKALETIERAQRFNPDDPALHEFLDLGKYAGQSCRLR
jgi:tetratricopeptide (TPR) repeat protein